MSKPSDNVKMVMEAVSILFEQSIAEWYNIKLFLMQPTFVDNIVSLSKSKWRKIDAKIIESL